MQAELNVSQGRASRRWVTGTGDSVMRSAEGCLVACANNFVWIDAATGLFPRGRALEARYACVRCSGLAGRPLYSVWNFSGGLSPFGPGEVASALRDMQVGGVAGAWTAVADAGVQGRQGACYACPPNTNTVAGRDVMWGPSRQPSHQQSPQQSP